MEEDWQVAELHDAAVDRLKRLGFEVYTNCFDPSTHRVIGPRFTIVLGGCPQSLVRTFITMAESMDSVLDEWDSDNVIGVLGNSCPPQEDDIRAVLCAWWLTRTW